MSGSTRAVAIRRRVGIWPAIIALLMGAMVVLPAQPAKAELITDYISSWASAKAADGAGVTTVSQVLGAWQVTTDGVARWDVNKVIAYDVKPNNARSTISFSYRVFIQTREAGGAWTTAWKQVRKCQTRNVVMFDPPNPLVTTGGMRVLVDVQPLAGGACNHHVWNRHIHRTTHGVAGKTFTVRS